MSKELYRAAKVNQEGAALLEAGETSKALKCFRAGLKLVNESCQRLDRNLPQTCSRSSFVRSTPIRLDADVETSPATTFSPAWDSSSNYSQAFLFDPEGKQSVQKQSYCSAVLIFNIGVTLHQKGRKEEGYKAYMKSILFYTQSLNLLKSFSSQPECVQIIQEIYKNQADIYYKINDLGNVQRCLEELISLNNQCQGTFNHQKTRAAVSA